MKKCGEIEVQFTAYLDGLLGAPEKKAVEEHLSTCPRCLREFEELQRTRAILARLDEVEPPSGLAEKIMDRIREQEERKGFFRRFFLPLHIKVPVQALATLLVVALSVYIYRSTLSEMGSFERPSSVPQVAETGSPPARQDTPPAGPTVPGKREPLSRRAEVEKKESARPPIQSPATQVTPEASPAPKSDRASAGDAVTAERAMVPERHADGVPLPSKVAPPPEAGRFKMRSMAIKKEKSQAQENAAASPPGTAVTDPRSRVTMISRNPRETSVQVKTILRSLGGAAIEEKTGDDIAVILGRIDTEVLGQLKDRLKEIAALDEPNSFFVSGPKSAFIEITIRRVKDGREGTPADR